MNPQSQFVVSMIFVFMKLFSRQKLMDQIRYNGHFWLLFGRYFYESCSLSYFVDKCQSSVFMKAIKFLDNITVKLKFYFGQSFYCIFRDFCSIVVF